MAKDPAFLFYPNDWIGGTMGMTFEEKGAYMELLMAQFNRGHMTKHMIGQIVGQHWDMIQDKFKQDDKGLYYNERLELEQTKRREYSKSRNNNRSGNNQYTKKPKKESGHMTPHMEDEDEDVNEDKDINGSEIETKKPVKKKKKSPHLFIDSEFFDFEKFASKVGEYEKYACFDCVYYHESLKNWSENDNKKTNWIATAKSWMIRDLKNNDAKLTSDAERQINNNGLSSGFATIDAMPD